jgi:hypothetical protein
MKVTTIAAPSGMDGTRPHWVRVELKQMGVLRSNLPYVPIAASGYRFYPILVPLLVQKPRVIPTHQ